MKKRKYYVYKPKEGTPLSPTEMQVLKMLCMDNATIAYRRNTTVGTVKQIKEHLFRKLGVKSRAAAVITAIRQGLLDIWDVILPTDVF